MVSLKLPEKIPLVLMQPNKTEKVRKGKNKEEQRRKDQKVLEIAGVAHAEPSGPEI